MTMIQVDRHIAIGDALHIDIEHLCGHLSIAHIASSGIDAGCISGNTDNISVHAGNVATRLGRRGLLHFSCYLIDIGHIALLIVIVRYEVLQLWTIVLRLKTASSIIFHRRLCGTFSPRMGKRLTINKHIWCICLPKHLQARVEPVGLLVHLAHHVLNLSLQLGNLRILHLLLSHTERRREEHQGCHI